LEHPLILFFFLFFSDLKGNAISGTIPTELGVLPLSSLILSQNGLTGSIPDQIASIVGLLDLELEDNALTGSLPIFTSVLSRLTVAGTNQLCPIGAYDAYAIVTDYPGSTVCNGSCSCNGGSCSNEGTYYTCSSCPGGQLGAFCELGTPDLSLGAGAVTGQISIPTVGSANIEITTNVPYPFMLLSPTFGIHLPFYPLVSMEAINFTLCPLSVDNTECLQVFLVNIYDVRSYGCFYSGLYNIIWSASCRPGMLNCDQASLPFALNFTIVSDNFCVGPGTITGPLTGTLESYSDNTFTQHRAAFLPNTTAYFEVVLVAGSTISSVTLLALTATVESVVIEIVSNQTLLIPSTNLDDMLPNPEANVFRFSLDLTAGTGAGVLFDEAVVTSPASFVVQADLEIIYVQFPHRGNRKRDATPGSEDTISLSLSTPLILK